MEFYVKRYVTKDTGVSEGDLTDAIFEPTNIPISSEYASVSCHVVFRIKTKTHFKVHIARFTNQKTPHWT